MEFEMILLFCFFCICTSFTFALFWKDVHSASPARLLVDDTHAYILTDCGGGNPVSAPGVGGS